MVAIQTYLQVLLFANVCLSIALGKTYDDQLMNSVKSEYCQLTQGEWFHRQERLNDFCHVNVALFGSQVKLQYCYEEIAGHINCRSMSLFV